MFSNLRIKLLLPICGVVLIGLSFMTAVIYYKSVSLFKETIIAQAEDKAQALADLSDALVGFVKQELEVHAQRTPILDLFDGTPSKDQIAEVNELLVEITRGQKLYMTMGISDLDGRVIANNLEVMRRPEASIKDRSFYRHALQGETFISEALQSRSSDGIFTGISTPLRRDGKIVGVLYIGFDLSYFNNEYAKKSVIGKTGGAMILGLDGKFIFHKDSEYAMSDLTKNFEDVQAMLSMADGEYAFSSPADGKNYHEYFVTGKETGWKFGMLVEDDDIFSGINTIRNISIIIALVTLLVVFAVTVVVVNWVVNSLKKGVVFAQGVASGNLDQTIDINSDDELGTLSNALRGMLASLRNMIKTSEEKTREAEEHSRLAKVAVEEAEEAKAAAEQAKRQGMLQAAAQLEVIVSEAVSSSRVLSEKIDQASTGSHVQRDRTTEAAAAMEEMNATVYEVARSATEAAKSSDNAKSNAEEGAKVVDDVVKSISEVNRMAENLKVSLDDLGGRAQGIGTVMTVINDIADQTNLLALNAAIEAARAGDAGRGFAVVADEVRKLAEKTMTATKEVGGAVEAIQKGTLQNIQSMDEAALAVQHSTELATRAGDSLKNIVGIVDSTADQVRSIAASSEQQSATSEQINRGTEEINRVAAQNAVLMGEASKAVGDLLAATSSIEKLIQKLKEV